MSAKTPPVAPKPRPKPRTSVKSPSEDKGKPQSSVAEGNGVATHMQPSDDPVPRPRPRVGTQLPGMADGGYLKPTSRPRVATNPISVTRDPSPTQHRRTTSDAKNDKEEPIYDTPWGKRLHPSGPPPVARKPASPSLGVPPGREKGGSNDTTPATQTQQSARSITPTRPPTRPPPFQAPSQRVSSPLPSPTPPPTVGGGRPKSISSNSGDEETPLSPKRQAPPPPASMGVNTTASSGSKPVERVKSPDRTQAPSRGGLSSSYQKKNDEKPSAEKVAEDMDFFSIELLKVASSAMIGVSMKVRSLHTKPDIKQEISAPFVAKVLPMGAVDKDGRIQVGDAIVEVNGRSLLQTTQEEATQGINETPGKSVRLKVGRPQGSISTMRAPQPAVPPDTSKITLEENSVKGSSDQESDSSLSRIEKLVAEKQCLEEERNEARSELERLRGQMQNVISENERTAAETISKAEEVQDKLNKELTDLQDQMKEIMKQREEQDSMLNKLEEKVNTFT